MKPTFQVTLGELARRIEAIRDIRNTLTLPDMSDGLTRRLYPTYLSYLPEDAFAYQPLVRRDQRGSLVELLKSPPFGQTASPAPTRGRPRAPLPRHQDREVLRGAGAGRHLLPPVLGGEVLRYEVGGEEMKVVDIPPGYTHSIENLGDGEMVTLFWSSEVFDPNRPDTFAEKVQ